MQQFVPSNDVELSIFTTEPAYGTEDIKTGLGWGILKFLKRDLRLGNLQAKYDDYEWLENQLQNTGNILSLRGGRLQDIAALSALRVISPIELSHSRNGFLRHWFRTFNINETQKEEKKPSIWGRIFK